MDDRMKKLSEHVWETLVTFFEEAQRTRSLVAKMPDTPQDYENLLSQRLSETHALENYLQLSNQLFAHLRVHDKPSVKNIDVSCRGEALRTVS